VLILKRREKKCNNYYFGLTLKMENIFFLIDNNDINYYLSNQLLLMKLKIKKIKKYLNLFTLIDYKYILN
jgi:hypothetical protein